MWYFLIFWDPKSWVVRQLVIQLVCPMFISNNRTSFQFWWKENLVKHRKVSKYYETDCLQNFLLHFLFLLTTNFVKNSDILAKIFCNFLESVLNQTWNAFNTKFVRQWIDRKSSCQVMEAFALFFQLDCSNFRLKQCQKPWIYQNCWRN